MKKEYSAKAQTMNSEFEITYDNSVENEANNNKLLQLLNHPWKLIKEGGKLGVTGVKRFFTVLLLFSISNTILFFYAISRLFSVDFKFSGLFYVFLVLIIGLVLTFYATYRTYQFVIIDTMRVIYESLSSFFQKISNLIIDKAESLFNGKVNISDNQLTKAFDFGKMVNTKFQKTPKFLRKGIILILNRIPLVGMLMDLKEDISKGNKVEASTKLYNKMDSFISESIFGNNNTKWVWWLLPLNILVVFLLIKYKIG